MKIHIYKYLNIYWVTLLLDIFEPNRSNDFIFDMILCYYND